MKESRHANFGAIQAIFLQLSWSQHKLAHSCQGRGQRSNGAINRNIHLFRSFCRGISNLVTPSLTVAELFQKEGMNLWCRSQNKMGPSSKYVSSQHIVDLRQPQVAMKHHLRSVNFSEFRPLMMDRKSYIWSFIWRHLL